MPDTESVDNEELKSLVDRIEQLEEEKSALSDDIRDVYAESASKGFDKKIIRQVVKNKKLDPNELNEQESMVDLYQRALGMI